MPEVTTLICGHRLPVELDELAVEFDELAVELDDDLVVVLVVAPEAVVPVLAVRTVPGRPATTYTHVTYISTF